MTENEGKYGKIAIVGGGRCSGKTAVIQQEIFEELQEYRAIGTIERFRELTEKAEPKKPYIQQVEIDFYEHDCMECPSCDSFLGYASDCKDEHYQDNYCPHCGQRLNFGEVKNERDI